MPEARSPEEGAPPPVEDGRPEGGSEPEWKRRKRLAEVFGDVLPDTTSVERGDEGREQDDDAGEEWLKSQVPPHHG